MIAIIIVLILFLVFFGPKNGDKWKTAEMHSGAVLNEGQEPLSVYDFTDRTAELVDAVCAKAGRDYSAEIRNFLNKSNNNEKFYEKLENWVDYGDSDAFLEFLENN